MKLVRVFFALCAVLALLGDTGCTPGARKSRALSRAAKYFAAGDLERAEIEYMNVLQGEPLQPDAISGLAVIYFDQGRIGSVFTYLSKARELQPNNIAVRTRMATLYLSAGKLAECAAEAEFVLQHQPDERDAALLLAQTCTQPAEIAKVRARLNQLPKDVLAKPPALVAFGILDLRSGDVRSAEAMFDRARKLDPNSSAAYLALANIYRGRNNRVKFEEMMATAAKVSPIRSGVRIQYAQQLQQAGQNDLAQRTLEEIIQKAPDCLPPYIMLANMQAQARKFDEAAALIAKATGRDPTNPEATTVSAHIHLAKGEADKAMAELERIITYYPQSAPLKYELGLACGIAGDLGRAAAALAESIRIDPTNARALLALADINVRQGNLAGAAGLLKKLQQTNPRASDIQFALANVFVRQRAFNDALAIYKQLETTLPDNPQPPFLRGMVLVQQDKPAEAIAAFDRAVRLNPKFLAALDQTINLHLRAKNYPAALDRVNAHIKLDPNAPGPYLMLAKVYLAKGDLASGEETLKKVIALQPDQSMPYMLLAQLYITGKQQDKAIEHLQVAAKNDPKNAEPLMMIGSIYFQQKQYPQAREYYEKTLAANPRFTAALNNLAYIYSEYLPDLPRAFELAQRARQLQPNEPHAADTLGWIVYKRGDYAWALSLLTESADRLPTAADVQYHVGMAHYMLGEEEAARDALDRVLKLDPGIREAPDAKKALAILNFNPASATAAESADIEANAAAHPDPVLLTRLAALREKQGKFADAAAAFERALKISPKNARAMMGLARTFQQRKETEKAIELAKNARKLAPTDPEVAESLGRLAFETGDYPWAFSLLQEAARAKPADADALFAFANAAYTVGQINDAEESTQEALRLDANFSEAQTARDFLEMIRLAGDGSAAAGSVARIQAALQANPANLPALMALGASYEHQGDWTHAVETYHRARKVPPNFPPAVRRLTLIIADRGLDDERAADIAANARASYASDIDVAKAYGMILFRKENYARAAVLLDETARSRASDPEAHYYLGVCQSKLNNRAAAVRTLQRALELNLNPDLAAKARAIIAAAKS